MSQSPKNLASILDVVDDYDALLLDLWGVVHDGQKLYPGVRDVIAELRARDKKIIFLSNAPRRAVKAAEVLSKFGIETSMYEHVITSGEALVGWLREEERYGGNYFYMGPDKDLDILDNAEGYSRSGLMPSHWILNVGFFYDGQPLIELRNVLRSAVEMDRPMVCANPDLEVVRQSGERLGCAGQVAARYEELGGTVRYFGKPHKDVYMLALKRLENIDPKRVLAVGDSLHTDILGANRMMIDSVLVTGGILHKQLHASGEEIDGDVLKRLIDENQGATPTYLVNRF